jgi:hypothetical protein
MPRSHSNRRRKDRFKMYSQSLHPNTSVVLKTACLKGRGFYSIYGQ